MERRCVVSSNVLPQGGRKEGAGARQAGVCGIIPKHNPSKESSEHEEDSDDVGACAGDGDGV